MTLQTHDDQFEDSTFIRSIVKIDAKCVHDSHPEGVLSQSPASAQRHAGFAANAAIQTLSGFHHAEMWNDVAAALFLVPKLRLGDACPRSSEFVNLLAS